jgi:hypothetical protein
MYWAIEMSHLSSIFWVLFSFGLAFLQSGWTNINDKYDSLSVELGTMNANPTISFLYNATIVKSGYSKHSDMSIPAQKCCRHMRFIWRTCSGLKCTKSMGARSFKSFEFSDRSIIFLLILNLSGKLSLSRLTYGFKILKFNIKKKEIYKKFCFTVWLITANSSNRWEPLNFLKETKLCSIRLNAYRLGAMMLLNLNSAMKF